MGLTDISFYQLLSRAGPVQTFVIFLIITLWGFVLLDSQPFDSKLYEDSKNNRNYFPQTPFIEDNPLLSGEVPTTDGGVPAIFNGSGNNDFTIIKDETSGVTGFGVVPVETGNALNCLFENCDDDQEITYTREEEIIYERNPRHTIDPGLFFQSRCDLDQGQFETFLCERGVQNGSWYLLERPEFWKKQTSSPEDASLLRACVQKHIERYSKDFVETDRRYPTGGFLDGLWRTYYSNGSNWFPRATWLPPNQYKATLEDGNVVFWYVSLNCNSRALPSPEQKSNLKSK